MRAMPRTIALVTLVLLACSALAQNAQKEEESPDYFAILNDSKLKYNITAEPSKTPIEEETCPRRDERTRLVANGDDRKLIAWAVAPEALKLLNEGERHYDAERMDEAAAKYRAALAIDPQAISGYFFLGDALLFGSNDAEAALEQYRKGIALDPSMPSGHFFASSAYARLGRQQEAREELVQALVYYPGYEAIWKIGTKTPGYWGVQPMVRHAFEPPAGYLGKKGKDGIDVFAGKDGEWLGYATCKAAWKNEKQFEERRGGSSGWSLEEERECLFYQLHTTFNITESRLIEEKKKSGVAEPSVSEEEIIAGLPPRERYIWDAAKEKLLDGYILFEIIGQKCPIGLSLLNDAARGELEKYIRARVVVAAK